MSPTSFTLSRTVARSRASPFARTSMFSKLQTPVEYSTRAFKMLGPALNESNHAKKTGSFLKKRLVPIVLLSLAGGFALSAFNDLAIFNGCSRKAIEKACQNKKIVEAIGEPILRGPWYNATLAVGYKRNTVSCTFPVFGPQGSGIFKLKAVRTGEDSLFSFLRHNDWDILVMDALLHIPTNDEKNQTVRINLMDIDHTSASVECKECKPQLPQPEK